METAYLLHLTVLIWIVTFQYNIPPTTGTPVSLINFPEWDKLLSLSQMMRWPEVGEGAGKWEREFVLQQYEKACNILSRQDSEDFPDSSCLRSTHSSGAQYCNQGTHAP